MLCYCLFSTLLLPPPTPFRPSPPPPRRPRTISLRVSSAAAAISPSRRCSAPLASVADNDEVRNDNAAEVSQSVSQSARLPFAPSIASQLRRSFSRNLTRDSLAAALSEVSFGGAFRRHVRDRGGEGGGGGNGRLLSLLRPPGNRQHAAAAAAAVRFDKCGDCENSWRNRGAVNLEE